MSSSRARNFRRRSEDGDANGVEEKPTPTPAPSTSTAGRSQGLPAAKPGRTTTPAGPKRLSFADDVEGEEDSSVRRPAAPRPPSRTPFSTASAHKLTATKDRLKSSGPPIPSNVQPQAGEYTKERLRELQKNARPLGSMPRPRPQAPSSLLEPELPKSVATPAVAATVAVEPVVVLKGLLKPTAEEEEEEEEAGEGEGSNGSEQVEKLPAIPDRATIEAIRAKRQQMQQPRRIAPDYISLDSGARPAAGGSSDDEDNELQGRIAMFSDKADRRTKEAGVFNDTEERVALADVRGINGRLRDVDLDEDDEDEEERRWEEEQFRKGLGRRLEETPVHRGNNGILPAVPMLPQPSIISPGPSMAVSRSVETMSIAQQADVATRALRDNISKLKESHKVTLNSLARTDTHLSEALLEITGLEESLQAADKKYAFTQELRHFISVLCDFLNSKAFYIEELEEQMQKLHEKQALAVAERRGADFGDEANEVEAAVRAAMSVLSKGTSSAYLSAATAAAQAAVVAVKENSNLPVELDEFGRDINLKNRMDYTRRSEQRKRRKAHSETKRMSSTGKANMSEQIEGEMSTDESDSESSAYISSRDELLQTADQIFSDASDEYSSLKIVKERFEGWKYKYLSTYRDAYVSLSVPALFSPYVRLELLKWDPLHDPVDFYDMEWHKLLFDYGHPGEGRDFDSEDPDANLIPGLVEKIALPILHHEIAHCWDLLSTHSTKNAVFATNMVISYIPSSSKGLHELLAAVNDRIAEAIAGLNVPSWGSVVTKAVPGAAEFVAYRFGVSVRLLRNICLWKNIIALPVLEKLALEELLAGKLLPHVKSIVSDFHDAITRTERIVASLSGVWSGTEVTAEPGQKLWPLVDFVAQLGSKLEKRRAAGVNEEETRGLARRLKNMLVALNEYDKARAMLRTFQLKEAL